MAPEKRFQVFVSSTSQDLSAERRVVIDALLEASYIPVGMELFNAASESAWHVITRLIDHCDYYVVIVAGRYGSLRPNGISFTQSEYEYAKLTEKPRLAFLRNNVDSLPRDRTESREAGMRKVRAFRRLLEADLLCKYWETGADEPARKVVSALNSAQVIYPQPGWVRGDSLIAEDVRTDLLEPARTLGIARIAPDGQAGPVMSESIAASKRLAIMSTSAVRFVEIQMGYLVEALSQGCDVRVLVPEPDSAFVHDVEEAEEREPGTDSISVEIGMVEKRLRAALDQAMKRSPRPGAQTRPGRVRIGHFSTHLRSTMVLCDGSWGWLTVTLPPARAPETASFELDSTGRRPLLEVCARHFDRTWNLAVGRDRTRELVP